MLKKFLEGTLPMDHKYYLQKGFSLAEALMAVTISTIVMSVSYFIYNSFQKTYVRQINHNIIKQEVRFAIHSLQLDFKMAGYKHIDSANNVQRPIYLTNTSGTQVSDGDEADIVYTCYDTIDNNNVVTRKMVRYQLRKEKATDTTNTVLMKQQGNTTDCINYASLAGVAPPWLPVARHFKKFKVIKYSNNILNFEIEMEDVGKQIVENYNAAAFMRNLGNGS